MRLPDAPDAAMLLLAAERARRYVTKEPGPNGHWVWRSSLNAAGYPAIGLARRTLLVSRLLYLAEYGTLPRRLRPLCSVRVCVKPDHREPVQEAPPVP